MKKVRLIFWVLTLGVNCLFAQGIWKSYTVEDGLAHNHVWCIKKDLNGNFWFGTKRGLSKFDTNGVWTTYLSEYVFQADECWVMDIEVDRNNHKWMTVVGKFEGLPDQRVVEFDDTTFHFYNPAEGIMPSQEPSSVGIDSAGSIWVGMADNYAWRFDGQQWHPFYVWGTRIYDTVNDITRDRHGELYFVHDAGISNLYGYIWPGVNTWIEMWRIAFDRQNRMWCATRGNGLRMLVLDPFKWTFYDENDGLLFNQCTAVAVDSNNTVWIALVPPYGVQCFNGQDWRTFNNENGLINSNVWDIFVESNGDIWFGTDGGVSVFRDTTTTKIMSTPRQTIPKQARLSPNYPNPFNAVTRIRYQIETSEKVTFSIFNSNGQLVSVIVDEFQHAGAYEVNWDARHNRKEVSSGVYYGVLQVGAEQASRKMLLIR